MKKILAITIALLSVIPVSAQADSSKTIAIIDTGYDSSISAFNGKISYEACFSGLLPTCPNKTYFQEGYGSAGLNSSQVKVGLAAHGTRTLSASINTNPNTDFVYIRAYSISEKSVFGPSDQDILNILNWIYANNSKLKVGAVVFSGGRNVKSCPVNNPMTQVVNDFKVIGVPVIMSAGNNYNNSVVNFPSCLDPVISIGSVDKFGLHALYSNSGFGLDFDALGTLQVLNYGGAKMVSSGTSEAAQVFAANWMAIKQAKPSLNYDAQYALIKATSTPVSNNFVKGVPAINLALAIKP